MQHIDTAVAQVDGAVGARALQVQFRGLKVPADHHVAHGVLEGGALKADAASGGGAGQIDRAFGVKALTALDPGSHVHALGAQGIAVGVVQLCALQMQSLAYSCLEKGRFTVGVESVPADEAAADLHP
ncbi:hypothetical protein ACFTZK_08120 [Streptomyces decoyicus]|uniref:hypothetical protein n=1 Tax=Streptomyces decoyicus TaxID=249567 RepID=UPI00362528C1